MAALPAKLDATFAAIKAKAPKATIVALPYLRVFPRATGAVPAQRAHGHAFLTLYNHSGYSNKLHTAIKNAAKRAKMRNNNSYVQKNHDVRAAPV